jgi:predicted ArsR family transcriptional regulator
MVTRVERGDRPTASTVPDLRQPDLRQAGRPQFGGTREAVARLVLEQGPQTAAVLAAQLTLSSAAIRRHLDALVSDGLLVEQENRRPVQRGRGRPARTYALTDAGRAAFPHAYDDLATTALRYLRETGGEQAVLDFAASRVAGLEQALAATVAATVPSDCPDGVGTVARADALAAALTSQGYAATTESAGANGVQICQHHCPVAHVAAEFPQLCDAETRALERVLGTYVQRLATIAHGDGVCTTHIPIQLTPPPTARSGRTS